MRTAPWMVPAALLMVQAGCLHRPPESPEALNRRFEDCMVRGRTFLAEAKYGPAAQAFEEAVRCIPASSQGHAILGYTYLKQKRTEAAEQALSEAVSLDPRNVGAWCNLGAVSVKQQRYGEALERLERAVALDSAFAPAQYSLGNLLMHLGDIPRARKALARAFELDPSLATAAPPSAIGFRMDAHPLETSLGFARAYASAGQAEETARFLEDARRLGFKDWQRLLAEADFDKVRDHPRIRAFLD